MKKNIFMVLVAFFVCGIDAGFADTYNCQVQEISNFSFKRSNEFLFPTYGDWNDANGRALVCGHRGTDGCNSGVMAFINGEHYWRNNRYDGMNVYLCSTGGANAWAQHDKDYIQLCADTDGKTKVGTDGRYDYYCTNVVNTYVNNWYCVGQNRTDICRTEIEASPAPAPNNSVCSTKFGPIDVGFAYIRNVTLQECKESKAHILEPKGLEFQMVCRAGPTLVCKATKCPNGYTPNGNTGKCDPTDNNGGGTGPNQCEQMRCNGLSGSKYNECVACCHVSSSVANWNGNTCICAQNPDSNKFVPNSNPQTGGKCIPTNIETPPLDPGYECDPVKIAQIMGWQIQYASNATISGQILAIIQYCDGNPNEITFNTMYNQLLALINQESAAAQLSSQQAASRRRIANAVSDIRSVVDNLDVSKWRTAEGNFNTSRLLSDSIAGVVLGTAGGLITSNVMKKNQASNGLEDIQCTVGGQVVAGWGDQFQVGIH